MMYEWGWEGSMGWVGIREWRLTKVSLRSFMGPDQGYDMSASLKKN